MPVRKGTAIWEGTLTDGKGTVKTATGTLSAPYSFSSRFEDGKGTNPEELLAAAHAGCFTMKLSGDLTEAGYTPDQLETESTVTLEDGVIRQSALVLRAKVSGIGEEEFQKIAKGAEENCPVSKALSFEITLLGLYGSTFTRHPGCQCGAVLCQRATQSTPGAAGWLAIRSGTGSGHIYSFCR